MINGQGNTKKAETGQYGDAKLCKLWMFILYRSFLLDLC